MCELLLCGFCPCFAWDCKGIILEFNCTFGIFMQVKAFIVVVDFF